MKKLSTTALMIATGMASSAQAADFEVNSTTTLEVFGAVELKYGTRDKIDKQGDTSSISDLKDNGSVVGVGAEHRFASGLTAYAAAEYAYSVLGDEGDDDESFARDESYFGLRGDFGDVRAGQYDNLFVEAIYDVIDPFEYASLGEESSTPDDSTLAYFSPDFGGFSFEAQTRVDGEPREPKSSGTNKTEDNDFAFIGVAKYTADRWAIHASVDDRGTDVEDGNEPDPSYGLAGVANVTDRLALTGRYATESDHDENDTDYYGVSASFDYGQGDLYAAAQEVDPDEGDNSRTEFAVGANYFIEENMSVYSEYGDFDRASTDVGKKDSVAEAGLIYEW